MVANDLKGGAKFDSRGKIGMVYIEHHITNLITKLLVLWFQRIRFYSFSLQEAYGR